MNYLQELVGKKIQVIDRDEGEFWGLGNEGRLLVAEIVFVIEDYSLNISNPICFGPALASLEGLLGKSILEITEYPDRIRISVGEGEWIEIDMRDEAWIGPEALVLQGPENLTVVWNGN